MGSARPFDSPGLAEGYARARPPLHGRILARAMRVAGWTAARGFGLDAGCGAGLSTRAMRPFVGRAAGADPVGAMVARAARLVEGARFIAASMERLPLRSGSCGLITAAGSLNYADVPAALEEAARVLEPGGLLAVYDFAPGCRFPNDNSLEKWFDGFLRCFPRPDDGAIPLDPPALRAMAERLFEPVADSVFREAVRYDAARYAAYMMTETNAAAAVRAAGSPAAIQRWMDGTLPAVFGGGAREVLFDAYFAVFAKPSSSSTRVAP